MKEIGKDTLLTCNYQIDSIRRSIPIFTDSLIQNSDFKTPNYGAENNSYMGGVRRLSSICEDEIRKTPNRLPPIPITPFDDQLRDSQIIKSNNISKY